MGKVKKYIIPLVLIIIIPQIVNLLLCYMMSEKQLEELPMAAYVGDNTSITRDIISSFDDNETFDIKYYVDSPNEIEELMEKGDIVFGLVIPKDFTKDLKKLKSPTILTVMDGTQLSSASFTKLKSTEILLTTKVGAMINAFKGKFSMSSTEALNTARAINITNRVIGNPTRNYINFLLPGMMGALVQVGIAMTAGGTLLRREKERKIPYYLKKVSIFGLMGFLSIIMIIGIQSIFFQVPFMGNAFEIFGISLAFSMAVSSVALLISASVPDKVFSAQVSAVFFIPSSILSGYTWPIMAMPEFFKKFSLILPFSYYGDTLRDLLLRGKSGVFERNIMVLIVFILVSFTLILIIDGIKGSKRGDDKVEILN